MSIRGVSFEIYSECNKALSKVLSGIDVGKYNWYIDQDQTEGWILNTNTDFFEYSFYTGELLNKIIQKPHYITFAKMMAYPGKNFDGEIQSFEDFMNSNCIILVLIYDCEYVEIYSKDKKVIEYYKNSGNVFFSKCDYITDTNDTRTRLDIIS